MERHAGGARQAGHTIRAQPCMLPIATTQRARSALPAAGYRSSPSLRPLPFRRLAGCSGCWNSVASPPTRM